MTGGFLKAFVAVCLFCAVLVLCSCERRENLQHARKVSGWEVVDIDTDSRCGYTELIAKKIEYEGHRFIVFDAYRRLAVTHDPNCGCFGKGGEDE